MLVRVGGDHSRGGGDGWASHPWRQAEAPACHCTGGGTKALARAHAMAHLWDMEKRWLIAVMLMALAVPLHGAGPGIVTIATASASASVDSGEVITSGGLVTVQLCGGTGGDVFSGSFIVKQGSASGYLAQTYSSGTITSMSACGAEGYVQLPTESQYTQVVITRTGGKQSSFIYWTPRATQ